MKKLHILLAITEQLSKSFAAMVRDYSGFFTKDSSSFIGLLKTYTPEEGTIDLPTERADKRIITTVGEKLKWFEDTSVDYINALFSQEATNASGKASADLVVDGKTWGKFSSLELLRLKSLVENGELEKMYQAIPCRDDDQNWTKTSKEFYKDRPGIFENERREGTKWSTSKETKILVDPNVNGSSASYKPVTTDITTNIKLGTYSIQEFSGKWTYREKAELLRRRQALLTAITVALKEANEVEAIESQLNAETLFNYLHRGA